MRHLYDHPPTESGDLSETGHFFQENALRNRREYRLEAGDASNFRTFSCRTLVAERTNHWWERGPGCLTGRCLGWRLYGTLTVPAGCRTVTPPSSCTLTRTPGATTFTREFGGDS